MNLTTYQEYARRSNNGEHLARSLGFLSIGLGVAELAAPRRVGSLIGIENHPNAIRALGLRDIIGGAGLLSGKRPEAWLRSRVIGDMMDLALLGAIMHSRVSYRERTAATAMVAASRLVLDLACSQRVHQDHTAGHHWRKYAKHIRHSILINRPAGELYRFWRNFENLPRFMKHLKSVQNLDGNRSHWVAQGPAGVPVEWDAEIINEKPSELLAWQSIPGSDVDNAGTVRFEPARGGRGTLVRVQIMYAPPGGIIGEKIAEFFRQAPEQQLRDDLRPFKQLMETGEISTTCGQSSGRHQAGRREK